jgi:hypothetical protein
MGTILGGKWPEKLLFLPFLLAPLALNGEENAETFGSGSGRIWLDDIKCTGQETNLLSCPQTSFIQDHDCEHSEDTGMRCLGEDT